MRGPVAGLALLLLTTPAFAAEHLEPERSVYEDPVLYKFQDKPEDVVSVFADIYDRSVLVRMIAQPSFSREFAVGLKARPEGYSVFSLHPKEAISNYMDMQERKNKDGSTTVFFPGILKGPVPVTECRQDIDKDLGRRILALWERMLRDVRYAKTETVGQDGADFHFSMFARSQSQVQFLGGRTWSPPEDSAPDLLIRIGMAMDGYCGKKDRASLAALSQSVSRLERHFRPVNAIVKPKPAASSLQKVQDWFSSWR